MIKIVKPGRTAEQIPQYKKTCDRCGYKKTCDRCGCEFTFSHNDISLYRGRTSIGVINCPTCGWILNVDQGDIDNYEEVKVDWDDGREKE